MEASKKAMDVYSLRMDVPFDMAAYCRGHKYSPEAVELSRAIKAMCGEELALDVAQQRYDTAKERLAQAQEAVKKKMEREDAV